MNSKTAYNRAHGQARGILRRRINGIEMGVGAKSKYTKRQGQYLAFIYYLIRLRTSMTQKAQDIGDLKGRKVQDIDDPTQHIYNLIPSK